MEISKPIVANVVTITTEQLAEIVSSAVMQGLQAWEDKEKGNKEVPTYWVGLSGIMSVFHCSKKHAVYLKNEVFPEAVYQRGRTILVDSQKALARFAEFDPNNM